MANFEIDEDNQCEACDEEEANYSCENCNAQCCEDCFGQNYCLKPECQEIEQETK